MEGERNLHLSTANQRNYIFLIYDVDQLVDDFKQGAI